MISCFGNHFKPLGPNLFFSRTSLLAATPSFGEVDVIATKRTYFSKTRDNSFLGDFGLRCVQKVHTLSGPAKKKKLMSNFPWLSTTIKIYHC